jgi:hypothetical protein
MASSASTITEVVLQRVRTKYRWPPLQLNFWLLIMLVGSSTILGVFASFLTVQQQLEVGVPWYVFSFSFPSSPFLEIKRKRTRYARRMLADARRYFPYWIAVASLSVLFILIMLWLISQRQLLPGIVIMGSFILFILWMVGLVVISVQLWGPSGSVQSNCNLYVSGNQSKGVSIETLGWLEQRSICEFFPFLFPPPFYPLGRRGMVDG